MWRLRQPALVSLNRRQGVTLLAPQRPSSSSSGAAEGTRPHEASSITSVREAPDTSDSSPSLRANAASSAVATPARPAPPVRGYFDRRPLEEAMAFIVPERKPRGELAPDATDPATGLPILHPKAMNLPMPPPTPDLLGDPEKWSFSLVARKEEHIVNNYHVPNSIAPAPLPMHLSSLTVPSMEKRRFCVATWASPEALGPISDARVDAFLAWLKRVSSTLTLPAPDTAASTTRASAPSSAGDAAACARRLALTEHRNQVVAAYHTQLSENISLSLGHTLVRGVYSQRHFRPGDVILEIPIDADPSNVSSYGGLLTSERLRLCSRVAGRADVKMPTFEQIVHAVNPDDGNEMRDEYHALFVDQFAMAVYIAVEKAALEASPLHPYFALFPDPMFDDEGFVDEVHRDVVAGPVRLDYKQQLGEIRFAMIRIQRSWPVGGSCPSLKHLMWGIRFVMARQIMLPHVRHHCDSVLPYASVAAEAAKADYLTHAIRGVHRFLLHNVLGVLDLERERANDFDVRTAPCVVPLLDMIGHDPAGISANIELELAGELGETLGGPGALEEEESDGAASIDAAAAADADGRPSATKKRRFRRVGGTVIVGGRAGRPDALAHSIVVRASEPIVPGQPLRRLFPRGYSLSYSLFRFGFLPLRHRMVDLVESAEAYGTLDQLPANNGQGDLFGNDPFRIPSRFLETRLDGMPPEAAAALLLDGKAAGGLRAAGQIPSK